MRILIVAILLSLVMVSGCTTYQPALEGDARPSAGEYQFIPQEKNTGLVDMSFSPSDGFRLDISVPDGWKEYEGEKESNFLVTLERPDGICTFLLTESGESIDSYRNSIRDSIADSGGEILMEDPLEYRPAGEDDYVFYTQTNGVECAGKTYMAFYSCLEIKYDMDKGEEIFDTMICREL